MISEIDFSNDESREEEYHEESALIQVIRNKSVIATCNASVSNGVVAGQQKVTTDHNEKINNRSALSTEQE